MAVADRDAFNWCAPRLHAAHRAPFMMQMMLTGSAPTSLTASLSLAPPHPAGFAAGGAAAAASAGGAGTGNSISRTATTVRAAAQTGSATARRGYDPVHWGVPEGSYASEPDGPARVREFRGMVAALHARGLRVVLDVVYNHTFHSARDGAPCT